MKNISLLFTALVFFSSAQAQLGDLLNKFKSEVDKAQSARPAQNSQNPATNIHSSSNLDIKNTSNTSGKNNIEVMQQEMLEAIVISCQENITINCAANEKVKSVVNSNCRKEQSDEAKSGCISIAESILSSLLNNASSHERSIYQKIYNQQSHILEKNRIKQEEVGKNLPNKVTATNNTTQLDSPQSNNTPIENQNSRANTNFRDTQSNNKLSSQNLCEKMKNSVFLVEYASIAENVYKSNYQFGTFSYDTKDKLVSQWLMTKIKSMQKEDSRRYRENQREWENQIKKCTEELASTNLVPLFVNSNADYNRFLSESARNPSKTNSVRSVDSSGNIVTKEVTTGGYKAQTVVILDSTGSRLNEETIPALLTILDPDNKFISIVHPEIKKGWEPIIASIEKTKKANIEFEQRQAIAEKEKTIALQKEKDVELKNQQENKGRIEKIRSGDYKLAKNCIELINALGDKIDQNDGASITPHQGLKSTAGKLARFGGDTGVILLQSRSGTTAAEFKTLSSTLWINKNDIRLNNDVFIIGKYTSNTSIKLSNGSSIQSPFLELICIQPS
jgi:hypothetical protein